MTRHTRSTAVVAVGAAILMALAVAAPASAQIHEFEKKLTSSQGSMSATVQGGSRGYTTTSSCSCAECVWLDMYDSSTPPSGDLIAHTTTTLEKGVPYLITIQGTFAVWPLSWWIGNGQGAVESLPQYPSPGTTNGRVVADFEYLFGWYKPTTPPLSLPVHVPFQGISVDGGVTYNDLVPLAGQIYSSSHVYQYIVVGQGDLAYFKKTDQPTYDNYGRLKICVQKLVPCGSTADSAGSGD